MTYNNEEQKLYMREWRKINKDKEKAYRIKRQSKEIPMDTLRKEFNRRYSIAESGCWIWTGHFTGNKGKFMYGNLSVKGKSFAAHRLSWELYNGKIPQGLFACHHCDNPKCVNPEHLFLGTNSDNQKDAFKKGRLTQIYHTKNRVRGESHYFHKLSDNDILKIRSSTLTNRELSLVCNVSVRNIYDIKNLKTWKHVS